MKSSCKLIACIQKYANALRQERNIYFLVVVMSMSNSFVSGCESSTSVNGLCLSPTTCSCTLLMSLDVAKAGVSEVRDGFLRLEVSEVLKSVGQNGLETGEIIESNWDGNTVCTRDSLALNAGDTVVVFVKYDQVNGKIDGIRVAHWDDTDINLGVETAPVNIKTEELGTLWDDPQCEERFDLSQVPNPPCNDVIDTGFSGDEESGDAPPDDDGSSPGTDEG